MQNPTSHLEMAADTERYRTLLEINNAVISNLTREPLFHAIAQALRRVLPIDRTAIFLHDAEKDVLRLFMLESSLPSSYFFVGLEMPAGDSHVGWVFRHQRCRLRRDLETEREYPMEERAFADGVRSYVIVPLAVRGRTIGTLALASAQPHQYAESDAAFLQEAAKQIALAVENMKAYEEIAALSARAEATAERNRALLEINNAVISNLTREALFCAITKALRRVVPSDRTSIFLYDARKDVLKLFVLESSLPSDHLVIGWEEDPEKSNVGWVLQNRQPLVKGDLASEQRFPTEKLSLADGVRSYVVVPLIVRGRCVGTLSVASTNPNRYSQADAAFLQEAAGQIALAVENMQAYEDLEREATLRRQAEEMLRSIAEGTAAATGADFFDSLVRHLACALHVRYAFVAECLDQNKVRARTLAFWRGEGLAENIEYDLAGTPCQGVVEGGVAHHPQGVQALFPTDQYLVTLEAESYLGVPVLDSRAQVIGHLVVLDVKPMEENDRTVALLRIFAVRAGAELERQRAEQSLREMHQFSREIIDGASEGIIVYDSALRYVVFNRFMEELTGRPADEILGRYAPDLFPFLRETGMEAMLRRALEGEVVSTPDMLIRMPTGREVWESNTYGPHRDAQGNIIGVIALVSDITQRKQAEEALRKALQEVEGLKNRLQAENVYLQEEIRREHDFIEMIGNSPALLAALRKVEKVASTDSTVLITGETGTGKELIARAIHSRSARKDRALVKVNCSAISAGLVESELFGHVKGAFTGALERREGRFELADCGTIFLDEVGELPLETQVKLLRVLQEGEFEPVGSSKTIRVDVRVIAATNRNLEDAVRVGRFRSDLFYRLNVFPIGVPALCERRSDIPQLVTFFLSRYAKEFGKQVKAVSQESMQRLIGYQWPGNIRELQNVIERAVVLSQGPVLELDRDLVPVEMPGEPSSAMKATGDQRPGAESEAPPAGRPADPGSLEEVERWHILRVLEQTGGVIEGAKGAAKILDLHPNTLRSRLKKLGIRRPSHEVS
ncbi:MAG TPA: sigma 54-interacting transcriptional regulator [Candidatus Methylomirabilis sp.]|nr:sigma 54-interacting transcriptional regulator [Candidatus Methylomirabilis sp.]